MNVVLRHSLVTLGKAMVSLINVHESQLLHKVLSNKFIIFIVLIISNYQMIFFNNISTN